MSAAATVTEREDVRAFLVDVGRALHEYGAPSYRLEEWLQLLVRKFGQEGNFFCTPTALFVAFGQQGRQRTSLVRVEPGEVNLKKLVELDLVLNEVWDDKILPTEGSARVAAIRARPDQVPRGISTLCHGLACACAARFFEGGPREILVAGAIGMVIGVLARLMNARTAMARVFEPVAAMLGTFLVFLARSLIGDLSTNIATLASLVVLLPGFSLTLAIKELALRHLASGTARFMGALTSLLAIGFGTAVGTKLGGLLAAPPDEMPGVAPAGTLWVALAVAPVAYTVLFRARFRDLGTIVIACTLAFFGARFGTRFTGGPELGAAFGAFVVAVYCNLYAWVTRLPAVVPMVPGIMLLVPGSLGFRSVGFLLHKDVLTGVDTAFTMEFVAISLVAGLLSANVVVPAKKIL